MLELGKCNRIDVSDARRIWGFDSVRRRLRRSGWRSMAEVAEGVYLPGDVARSLRCLSVKPWSDWSRVNWVTNGRRCESMNDNFSMGMRRLSECGEQDYWVYTDGSAGGLRDGGAGVIVARGCVSVPDVVERMELPAGVVASSFQAELHAVRAGLEWLFANRDTWRRACIVSDSQSVLVCLRGCRGGLREGIIARCAWLLSELCLQDKWLCMVWIPGHCAIVGNELADAAAARGCRMMQNHVECLPTSIHFV